MNSDHDHISELLPSLALGALTPDEREQTSAHLAECEGCPIQLTEYEAVVDQLGLGAPIVPPPEALKQRLMRRIQTPVRVRVKRPLAWFSRLAVGWPRLVATGVLAGSVLAVVLGLSNLYLWRHMNAAGQGGLENVHLVHLRATDTAPGASGTLLMAKDGGWGVLVVQGMPMLDADRQYQLWLIDDGQRTSGGVFSVSTEGAAQVKVIPTQPMKSYEAFGITIEPHGGSPGPTGAKVLGGRIEA
ncbi:MAG: anti-sigma factor [Desulfatitalea sp.]